MEEATILRRNYTARYVYFIPISCLVNIRNTRQFDIIKSFRLDCGIMNKTRNKCYAGPTLVKEILIFSLLLLVFPEKYIGQCSALQNRSSVPFKSVKNNVETDLTSNASFVTEMATIEDPNYQLVTGEYVIFSLFSFLMSVTVLALTFSYLKSVSVSVSYTHLTLPTICSV